ERHGTAPVAETGAVRPLRTDPLEWGSVSRGASGNDVAPERAGARGVAAQGVGRRLARPVRDRLPPSHRGRQSFGDVRCRGRAGL
ncbi:MAG: hypothetical protein AVDCRST_MAG64-1518, partial [uncultured Phycisphaerae bacterium]